VTRSALICTAVIVAVGISASCASGPKPIVERHGVVSCPAGAGDALLEAEALQCWFPARHGQWRTLSHESHYDVLVVKVEALDLRDAEEIAARFVAHQRDTFSEIMVYARPPFRSGATRVRRVRWTREQGSETFDFVAPAGDE
jgi:hypothetical protein